MTNKNKYIEFCKKEKDMPIFSKDWWLDCVCGQDRWDVVLVEKNGHIIGTMPYYQIKRTLIDIIIMPELTHTMGVYIKYPDDQKYAKRLAYEKDIMIELIGKLPNVDLFSQSFHYDITNWLPFYWKGYQQTTQYTHIIEDLTNLDNVFNNFNSSAKKNIRKAKRNNIKIIDSFDINTFYKINKITFEKQGLQPSYSLNFLKKLFKALLSHNSCIMKFAVKDQQVYSVMLGVYDSHSLYMLIGSSDRNIQTFGAEYLLYWEMMKFASEKGLKLDFEGSIIEGVEQRNRSFGAIQKPYFRITKTNSKFLKIKQLLKAIIK